MVMPTMIRTVLVANRGEIARRVFRTCREMGIRTVAVYSDADVGALFVADADVAVHLGSSEPTESYLDIEKVVAAAVSTGADAIHPGYGFLSENAYFARACAEAGLIFIGPSPAAITAMGSKIESKRIMKEAGVPTLPSADIIDGIDAADASESIGYPMLVKASAGGGGKGMRLVEASDQLEAAIEGARREAASAFGDGTVFLEKYLIAPRHVEVQILGDTHGTVVSVGERECSVQRRHQKVIEEAPSPVVDEALRSRLGAAAVSAAKQVDYVGAGTVEFLLDAHGSFFFLEMNTRLQVEHAVTELVTNTDLVRSQIEIAEGSALSDTADLVGPIGHAVEARVYAEDPANDFLPSTGTISAFDVPTNVRVDSGVGAGSEVSIYYDPMLAKIISHGPTRNDAIRILAAALRASRIHGVTTNQALLVRILEHEDFISGDIHTAWLESLDSGAVSKPLASPGEIDAMALAASMGGQAHRRSNANVLATLPSGFRNNPSQLTIDEYQIADRSVAVGYRVDGQTAQYSIDGEDREPATLLECTADSVRLRISGRDRDYTLLRVGSRIYVHTTDCSAELVRKIRLPIPEVVLEPGSLLSPMPGKVVRVEAAEGDVVAAGTTLVVVEAMKMEHTVAAPHDGTVRSLTVVPGDQVEAAQVLAVVDPA